MDPYLADISNHLFDKLPIISAKQEELNTSLNQVQHVTIQLNHDEIKILQLMDPHYSVVIKDRKNSNVTYSRDFSLDPQGVLYKTIRDNDKDFTTLTMPKTI